MNTFTPRLASPAAGPARAPAAPRRGWLALAFAGFNTLRVVAYLPTLLAIVSSGRADQHSLFTWFVFCGANATMALWLHEQNGRRIDRAVAVNSFNALMCAGIAACLAWIRWVTP